MSCIIYVNYAHIYMHTYISACISLDSFSTSLAHRSPDLYITRVTVTIARSTERKLRRDDASVPATSPKTINSNLKEIKIESKREMPHPIINIIFQHCLLAFFVCLVRRPTTSHRRSTIANRRQRIGQLRNQRHTDAKDRIELVRDVRECACERRWW